ncbi:MAG: SecD/SecF family protein translocase subunit, partial [Planctomycetota bacterium]
MDKKKKSPLSDVWWRIALIVGIVLLCTWAIIPPEERIRLGKDLRGGVSLIYHVRIDPNDPDPEGTLTQVITVLKDRVNPTGVLDIAMRPLGRDRIEIVMPLPNKEVLGLRADYERSLANLLRDALIPPGELQTALEAFQAIERFGGEGERGERVAALQAAFDMHQAAFDDYEAAREAGKTEEELRPLADAVAVAALEFEAIRSEVLAMSLSAAEVERTIRLSAKRDSLLTDDGKQAVDETTGEKLFEPSARDIAVEKLAESYPHLADQLQVLVADWDGYNDKRTGFDDPEDLMRLLRGAGVLAFHIAVRSAKPEGVNPEDMRQQLAERGPKNTDSPVARWYEINDIKQWYDSPEQLAALEADPVGYFARPGLDLVAGERDGVYYLLLYTTEAKSITHREGQSWSVVRTGLTIDNFGRDAVAFNLDDPGGALMNRLTSRHINEPMAIVLDDQVYSAPNINSTIGKSGVIVGNFSQAELSYLIRVLAAGSLEAKLSPDPIAINTLGPSIGQGNLRAGLDAFIVAIIAVAIFMLLYYFFAGSVADLALVINGVIIFGVMSLIDGTFTLPGLAGIVLTIGMAVDANVLIYERVREEIFGGESDLRNSIRLGYAKALSTIIDANVT